MPRYRFPWASKLAVGAATAIAMVSVFVSCSSGADSATSPSTVGQPTAGPTSAGPTSAQPTSVPAGLGTALSAPSSAPPSQLLGPAALIAESLTAQQIADRLSEAELALRDAAIDDTTRRQAGVDQQLLYRLLAANPSLDPAVLALVDNGVRETVQRTVGARQFAQARSATSAEPATVIPAWSIQAPLPADLLLQYYHDAEQQTGVPWYWLAAIHIQETRAGRVVGVSSAGAVGPMQFLPTTWAACCIGDPLDPAQAIVGAATYLAQSGGPDDMAAAVYQYNPSDTYVALVTAMALNMRDAPQLYVGYWSWQVFVSTDVGSVRLPIGYAADTPMNAAEYLLDHPEDAATKR